MDTRYNKHHHHLPLPLQSYSARFNISSSSRSIHATSLVINIFAGCRVRPMLVEGERWIRSLGDGLGKPDIAAGMFALFLFPPSYFYISFPSFPLLLLFTYIWWKLQHGISQVLTSLTDDRRIVSNHASKRRRRQEPKPKKRAISPTTQYRSGIQLNSRLDRSTTTPTTTSSLLHAHFQKESKSTSPTPAKLENSTTLAPLLPLPAQNSPWPTYLLPTSLLPPSYLPPTSLLPPSPTLLTPSTVRLRKLHPLSCSPL